MDALRKRAKELLTDKTVNVVIGFEEGTVGCVRAAFATNPERAEHLIYDERCLQNLAVYLTKAEVKALGKAAIVATTPIMRSLVVLISENQVKEEDIVVLGITPEGQLQEFISFDDVEKYISQAKLDISEKDRLALEKLRKMTAQERWDYWQYELARCFRCYACRSACPMCYCKRCSTDCNQPQLIPVSSHIHANYDWHLMRAMHLAGRCVSCGDCGRSCPLDIPVHLLTMFTAEEVVEMFGTQAGLSRETTSVLSTYKPEDKENFIE